MAHESSNDKPGAESGATSRGRSGVDRPLPATPVVKPGAESGATSGSHRPSSRPATKKDPSEDSGAADTKQPKKEDRGRGGRRTRNRFEEEE